MYLQKCRTVRAEVFARLPAEMRVRGRRSSRTAGQKAQPGETDCFLEGPAFDAQGNLYVTDVPFGRIFRVSPSGSFELVIQYEGEPCGIKFTREGRMLVTDQLRGLVEIDVSAKKALPFLSRRYSECFRGVNDLCIGHSGEIYFTEQGLSDLRDPTGKVYCLGDEGRIRAVLEHVPSPNGIVLSPDQNVLYVAMTRANAVWRCPLMIDGSAAKVGAFVNLSGGHGPDGIAVDESGGLVVAHAGVGVVWVFDARGEAVMRIESPVGDMTTNIAFGGPDRRTLYITESQSGSILAARVDVAGAAMHGLQHSVTT